MNRIYARVDESDHVTHVALTPTPGLQEYVSAEDCDAANRARDLVAAELVKAERERHEAHAALRKVLDHIGVNIPETCTHDFHMSIPDEVEAWIRKSGADPDDYKSAFEAELAGNKTLRERYGAASSETMDEFIARLVRERDEVKQGRRRAAQMLIEEIGAPGPESIEETAERAVDVLRRRSDERDAARDLAERRRLLLSAAKERIVELKRERDEARAEVARLCEGVERLQEEAKNMAALWPRMSHVVEAACTSRDDPTSLKKAEQVFAAVDAYRTDQPATADTGLPIRVGDVWRHKVHGERTVYAPHFGSWEMRPGVMGTLCMHPDARKRGEWVFVRRGEAEREKAEAVRQALKRAADRADEWLRTAQGSGDQAEDINNDELRTAILGAGGEE